ncbi:MAG: formylmethanofuran dehydrogenase [Firmicutes bacterium]|nr:formylmethanofuran dehydrogenase [Bacillota bacterium]MBQ4092751.1 formylmethanofuran dehydrogenase [Bacillota bacterium]
MIDPKKWETCVSFHGHECGGLTIGYKAAVYAGELLGLNFSADEDVVCIAENDACGIDAIQVLLGCTVGKGNLLFHITGKQAFSFYDRRTGKSLRLVLKPRPEGMTRAEAFGYYQKLPAKEMFEVKETSIPLPSHARIFKNIVCEHCGEDTAEAHIRLENGKYLCPDCIAKYNRFDV